MASRTRESNTLPDDNDLGRVILLMDVDCFEVQVWAKKKGIDQENVPVIVVNHLDMIMSINYEARALGIQKTKPKESVDLEDLQDCLPELRIIRAELKRGLSDTLFLQKESDKILDAIRFHPMFKFQEGGKHPAAVIERANNDEVYIDCTGIVQGIVEVPSSGHQYNSWPATIPSFGDFCREHYESPRSAEDWDEPEIVLEDSSKISSNWIIKETVGKYRGDSWSHYVNRSMLMYGAAFARAFHLSIWRKTGYRVSFGVAHNKMLAKIACEENKPNAITMLTNRGRHRLFKNFDFCKLPGFKRETGDELRDCAWEVFGLNLVTLEDVRKCPRGILDQVFDLLRDRKNLKDGTDSLKQKVAGICNEPVVEKYCNSSISKSLSPNGKTNYVRNWQQLQPRIEDLADAFYDWLVYHYLRHNEKPDLISVRTEMKKGRGHRRVAVNVPNTLEGLPSLPTVPLLQDLIEEYVELSHGNYFGDIDKIKITASNFVPFPRHGY